MRRTLLGLVTVIALAAGSTLATVAPAQAAAKPVKIKKITTRSIDWYGSARVKPVVTKAKKVKILKKTMTVRQGGKVVRKNRGVVKLRPGTYRVATKVVYRHKGKKRVTIARQSLVVRQKACATLGNYRTLKADPDFSPTVAGDSVATVAKKLRTSGSGEAYTPEQLLEQLAALKVLLGSEMPELAALIDGAIAEVKALQDKGVTRFEDREYIGCGNDDISVYATFANGELMAAEDDADLMTSMPTRAAVNQLLASVG